MPAFCWNSLCRKSQQAY